MYKSFWLIWRNGRRAEKSASLCRVTLKFGYEWSWIKQIVRYHSKSKYLTISNFAFVWIICTFLDAKKFCFFFWLVIWVSVFCMFMYSSFFLTNYCAMKGRSTSLPTAEFYWRTHAEISCFFYYITHETICCLFIAN